MHYRISAIAIAAAGLMLGAFAHEDDGRLEESSIKHVLLISIDGMHALDFTNCAHGIAGANGGKPYCPNLAALSETGVNYVAANTSKPSDSFPGLMNIVSGATPRLMGVYYDVAYDRSLDGPAKTTGNGNAAAPCDATKPPTGYTTEYEEGLDIDQTQLNGGAPGAQPTDGGVASLDPTRMDRDPAHGCKPVYPWEFVRTNTIYGVIHKAGGYTAWSDKHPAYSSVAGRDGVGVLDDYSTPEINSNVVGLKNVTTADGLDCSSVPDPNSDLTAWTNSFLNIKCYDTLKANAILNEIAGWNHLHTARTKTPTIFGMNFQAVSVGQKLIENGVKGGYLDAAGTPSDSLLGEIEFVDDAIGQMVLKIKDRGLYESTLIIITAKHGQSPIDPNRFFPIPGHKPLMNGTPPSGIIGSFLPAVYNDPNNGLGLAEDDISQIWLADSTQTGNAVMALEGAATAIGLGQIYYGGSLTTIFNPPGVPNVPGPCCHLRAGGDPRSPDIVVIPNVGVVYTGNLKKQSEHGGFAHDDTNVVLLVSSPGLAPQTIHSFVETAQVAPTILKILGLDPNALDAVRQEGTPVLPGLFGGQNSQ